MDEAIKKIEKEILERIRKDSQNKDINPLKRLESNSDKSLRYSGLLYIVNKKLYFQKSKEQKRYSELFKKNRWDSHYMATKKADIESLIFQDEKYMQIKEDLSYLENLSELLKNVVRIYIDKEYSERVLAKASIEGLENA